jgi:hypothetical protein
MAASSATTHRPGTPHVIANEQRGGVLRVAVVDVSSSRTQGAEDPALPSECGLQSSRMDLSRYAELANVRRQRSILLL